MSRKRRNPTAQDLVVLAEINQQILRLREMLVLMAPETGASALGASFTGYRDRPREPQLLLPSPDAANL
jgi:hypothetical protein